MAFVVGAGLGAGAVLWITHVFSERAELRMSVPDAHTVSAIVLDHHDYQLLVQKMATSMLKQHLGADDSAKPVISLGLIENRTPYNIPVEMVGNEIRAEVMKSGLAKFSTATDFSHKGGESGALYKQLQFQNESGHVNGATAKKYGHIVSADYLLFGNIYSLERRAGRTTEANFKFNLTLTDVATGLAVWSDTEPVRKMLR